jgi:Ser/Thr protein kinase RdoA (MazF antagonist)
MESKMVKQHFPVTHSTLSEEALIDWVRLRYPLKEPVCCRFLRQSISDVYRVDTPDASYILKIYMHGRHPKQAIEAEIDFLHDLLDHDIPVAVPVENHDTLFLNEIDAPEGVRYAVLFTAITGNEPQETNLEHSHNFGRLAGRMHHCADQLGKRYARGQLDETHLIADPLNQMSPYLRHRPRDYEYLSDMGDTLITELHSLVSKEKPEYGVCHGDLHTGNARFDQGGRLTLFDFDSFGYGWRAIDIGVYHVSYDWFTLSAEIKREKDRFWAAFVDGYSLERSLSQNELLAAQLCFPLRHFELMGLTMRYWSPQIGTGWINDDYFDQHISWFKRWSEDYKL